MGRRCAADHGGVSVGDGAEILVRDNDRAFGAGYGARVPAIGIRDRPTSFGSPWQNRHVEWPEPVIRRYSLIDGAVFDNQGTVAFVGSLSWGCSSLHFSTEGVIRRDRD